MVIAYHLSTTVSTLRAILTCFLQRLLRQMVRLNFSHILNLVAKKAKSKQKVLPQLSVISFAFRKQASKAQSSQSFVGVA